MHPLQHHFAARSGEGSGLEPLTTALADVVVSSISIILCPKSQFNQHTCTSARQLDSNGTLPEKARMSWVEVPTEFRA